jgi:hypothetical protein
MILPSTALGARLSLALSLSLPSPPPDNLGVKRERREANVEEGRMGDVEVLIPVDRTDGGGGGAGFFSDDVDVDVDVVVEWVGGSSGRTVEFGFLVEVRLRMVGIVDGRVLEETGEGLVAWLSLRWLKVEAALSIDGWTLCKLYKLYQEGRKALKFR